MVYPDDQQKISMPLRFNEKWWISMLINPCDGRAR
jgi:hypothetical protein